MEVSKSLRLCLIVWNVIIAILSFNNGVEASHGSYPEYESASTVRQLHRTGYHFQPPQHWLNGTIKKIRVPLIHIELNQNHEKKKNWVRQSGGDTNVLSHYNFGFCCQSCIILKVGGYQLQWYLCSSATVFPDGNPVIYYTGVDAKGQQVQNYAIPADRTDKNLRKWVKPKEGNPMVVADKEINGSAFLDPTTAWQANGYWNILVGSRKGSTGVAYLFKSKDKKTWTKTARPLHEVPNTGMWECPDFFPVSTSHEKGLDFSELGKDGKHVLKVSLDVTRFERVVWGWANESGSKEEDVKKGWAGIMPIPRTLRLDPSGKQLLVWPIDEFETLKGNKVQMSNQQLETGKPVKISGITGNQVCSTVMTNIDNSVVESLAAGGKICITSRVYPTLAVFQDAQVFAFNNGTEPITLEHASAWSMESPRKMNN
ncbi:hypothetical protein ES288_D09G167300v1 [Gossypium darwinii]|uniref:Glycosyl hydrolase family 32 N-terminal domain-containing protein n=1 Tax=Gossypium darwinii TaxID=34276 RepID=A0A5D2BCY3_GOSDA|nr:hypothetical protein ES288_D09G167300v1 [Gossypium darwinii]